MPRPESPPHPATVVYSTVESGMIHESR